MTDQERAKEIVGKLEQIANDLVDQREEPDMFGLSYDRVHYWRDKAITAADRLRHLITQGEGEKR